MPGEYLEIQRQLSTQLGEYGRLGADGVPALTEQLRRAKVLEQLAVVATGDNREGAYLVAQCGVLHDLLLMRDNPEHRLPVNAYANWLARFVGVPKDSQHAYATPLSVLMRDVLNTPEKRWLFAIWLDSCFKLTPTVTTTAIVPNCLGVVNYIAEQGSDPITISSAAPATAIIYLLKFIFRKADKTWNEPQLRLIDCLLTSLGQRHAELSSEDHDALYKVFRMICGEVSCLEVTQRFMNQLGEVYFQAELQHIDRVGHRLILESILFRPLFAVCEDLFTLIGGAEELAKKAVYLIGRVYLEGDESDEFKAAVLAARPHLDWWLVLMIQQVSQECLLGKMDLLHALTNSRDYLDLAYQAVRDKLGEDWPLVTIRQQYGGQRETLLAQLSIIAGLTVVAKESCWALTVTQQLDLVQLVYVLDSAGVDYTQDGFSLSIKINDELASKIENLGSQFARVDEEFKAARQVLASYKPVAGVKISYDKDTPSWTITVPDGVGHKKLAKLLKQYGFSIGKKSYELFIIAADLMGVSSAGLRAMLAELNTLVKPRRATSSKAKNSGWHEVNAILAAHNLGYIDDDRDPVTYCGDDFSTAVLRQVLSLDVDAEIDVDYLRIIEGLEARVKELLENVARVEVDIKQKLSDVGYKVSCDGHELVLQLTLDNAAVINVMRKVGVECSIFENQVRKQSTITIDVSAYVGRLELLEQLAEQLSLLGAKKQEATMEAATSAAVAEPQPKKQPAIVKPVPAEVAQKRGRKPKVDKAYQRLRAQQVKSILDKHSKLTVFVTKKNGVRVEGDYWTLLKTCCDKLKIVIVNMHDRQGFVITSAILMRHGDEVFEALMRRFDERLTRSHTPSAASHAEEDASVLTSATEPLSPPMSAGTSTSAGSSPGGAGILPVVDVEPLSPAMSPGAAALLATHAVHLTSPPKPERQEGELRADAPSFEPNLTWLYSAKSITGALLPIGVFRETQTGRMIAVSVNAEGESVIKPVTCDR